MKVDASDRERIAQLVAAIGRDGAGDWLVEPMLGTGNRVFRVVLGERSVVVRLAGRETSAMVDRTAERHNLALASAAGLGPALLFADPADGAMVMEHLPGRVLSQLLPAERLSAMERLGQTLARLHGGAAFDGRMDPWEKIAHYLDLAGLDGPADGAAFGDLWPRLAALREVANLDSYPPTPCHVDPVLDNAIDDGARVRLIDWEYAAMSAPQWDLAYVCVEGGLADSEEAALLAGYDIELEGIADLAAWKHVVRAVSAAWCLARLAAASGENAALWRHEVANRLASLAAELDDPGSARPGRI